MNRSESGSSLMSSMAVNANQIDQVKIERLLTVFNLMQKNDNIMHIIMLAMRELKSLIPT
jgi:3-methyladenine DNA glycosylase AlkC